MKPASFSKTCGAPFRCIFRDYKTNGPLSGHALYVTLKFVCAYPSAMSHDDLEQFVLNDTQWANQYLEELLTDTVLISRFDPLGNVIIIMETESLIDVRLMDDVSLEGLSKMIKEDFSLMLNQKTEGVVELAGVEVLEATFA